VSCAYGLVITSHPVIVIRYETPAAKASVMYLVTFFLFVLQSVVRALCVYIVCYLILNHCWVLHSDAADLNRTLGNANVAYFTMCSSF